MFRGAQVHQEVIDHPEELPEACSAFAVSPQGKGFQTGLLSPIVNALHPDQCLLITAETRCVINWVERSQLSRSIADYPAFNEAGRGVCSCQMSDRLKPSWVRAWSSLRRAGWVFA